MIPSDHFVMFYNEVFKFLIRQGPKDLDRFYERVAARQGNFTLDEYRRKGLKGVYDYYCRIRREENCDMDLELTGDYLFLKMKKCPSLTKALESDAGACPVYCDHCPGWCMRVMTRAGYWEVYDMVSRMEPVCDEWIYTDREKCRAKYRELVAKRGPDLVRTNLDDIPPFLAGRVADSSRFDFFHPNIAKALAFLRETDLRTLEPGRHPIDSDAVYANVFRPEFVSFEQDGEVEAHRLYMDIHVPIVGTETMGTFTLTEREMDLPFDVKNDIVLFRAKCEPLEVKPGEFVMFFPPYGGHLPNGTQERLPVKDAVKAVVKVRLEGGVHVS